MKLRLKLFDTMVTTVTPSVVWHRDNGTVTIWARSARCRMLRSIVGWVRIEAKSGELLCHVCVPKFQRLWFATPSTVGRNNWQKKCMFLQQKNRQTDWMAWKCLRFAPSKQLGRQLYGSTRQKSGTTIEQVAWQIDTVLEGNKSRMQFMDGNCEMSWVACCSWGPLHFLWRRLNRWLMSHVLQRS